jgi:transposase InsO family protein
MLSFAATQDLVRKAHLPPSPNTTIPRILSSIGFWHQTGPVAESFFSSLKREMEDIDGFESCAGAALSVGEYIDDFYNYQRRRSAINYNSPVDFELLHSARQAA